MVENVTEVRVVVGVAMTEGVVLDIGVEDLGVTSTPAGRVFTPETVTVTVVVDGARVGRIVGVLSVLKLGVGGMVVVMVSVVVELMVETEDPESELLLPESAVELVSTAR
jgi:hypothetical protein